MSLVAWIQLLLIGFAIGYFTFRNTDVENVDKTINNQKYTITFEVKKQEIIMLFTTVEIKKQIEKNSHARIGIISDIDVS